MEKGGELKEQKAGEERGKRKGSRKGGGRHFLDSDL